MAIRQNPKAAPDKLTPFRYEADDGRDFPKKSIRLMSTETLTVGAQIINQGGETNMHSHTNADEAWIVTAGRARFYGMSDDPTKGEEMVAELGPAAIDDDPDWSPNGRKILFTSHAVTDNTDNHFTAEIYVVNPDGKGKPVRLTNNSEEERAPSWSPDGGQRRPRLSREEIKKEMFQASSQWPPGEAIVRL